MNWVLFIGSMGFSILIYKGIHFLLFTLRKQRKPYFILLGLTTLAYMIFIVGSYVYYFEMNIMPNYYTFGYIKTEPYNSWTLFRDSFHWYYVPLFALSFSLLGFILFKTTSIEKRLYNWPRWGKILHGISTLVLLFMFNNQVRFMDQCMVSDVNTISFVSRHFYTGITGKHLGAMGLLARNRIPLEGKFPRPDYNVLVIITESLRSQNLQLYGYERKTTPFLCSLKTDKPDNLIYFPRAFTNSTTTMLSVPGLLTGISPAQPARMLHTFPLFWEYAKPMDYTTFFITSHDHGWRNYKAYFSSHDIDFFWNKETSRLPGYNDLGIADSATVECFEKHVTDLVNAARPFAGVLHLNTNHFPYNTPPEFKKWTGTRLDNYDNTILYQDYLLRRVFRILETLGVLEKTFILFTSDHGEAFKEHNFIGHLDIYYIEAIAIPLIIYLPAEFHRRFDIESLKENRSVNVSNLDIMPTLLDVFQISQRDPVKGLKYRMLGTSLFSPIDPKRKIILSNTNEVSRYKIGVSLVWEDMHYMLRVNQIPVREELYNFIEDKWETRDLWAGLTSEEKKEYYAAFWPYASCMRVFSRWNVEIPKK
jgi:glucan phosphoethanolaminetransferase (alkaline phosphatase superfamily)